MMEACLDVHDTFFPHILIPLDLFSFHCNELYSFSQMGFRNDDLSFHYCHLLSFCLWSPKVCTMSFVGATSLLVSRAVVWDTVGMHNGYVLCFGVRGADFPMHQILYNKIDGVEELLKNPNIQMFCIVNN